MLSRAYVFHSIFAAFLNINIVFASSLPETLNQTMSEIGDVMAEIYPLVFANRAITKEESSKLGHDLAYLELLFRNAESHFALKSNSYRISYRFILDYLKNTKQIFDTGDTDGARAHFYAFGEICVSCHTQDSKLTTLFATAKRHKFNDDLSYADFNFATRNYDLAIKYYDKHLYSSRPKTELSIIQPLQRLITIYVQVQNNPKMALTQLKKYQNLKDHTAETKQQLQQWMIGLKNLENTTVRKSANPDFSTLKNYAVQILEVDAQSHIVKETQAQQEIASLWLRGILYRYLTSKTPLGEVPHILLWLAKCDRQLSYNYYFSLADLYLKECILGYSSEPVAQQCFDEYNNHVVSVYSTSSGTDIPLELQLELQALREAITTAGP
ncbi:hypothetical protein [Kaarinaea lacus]